MKKRFCQTALLLACVFALLVITGVTALAETSNCTHDRASIERPTGNTYAATCTEPGGYIIRVECADCGAFINEYKQADAAKYPVQPAAHKLTTKTTAGECGVVTQQICTLCGYTTTDTASGSHSWESKTHTASSCNEESYTYEECSKCGLTRNYKAVATVYTHTFNTKPVKRTIEPTCGAPGETQQECDCGEVTRILPIAATGNHAYADAVTKPGDCSVSGSKTVTSQTCQTCGYVNVISSVAPSHDFVETVTKAATCTSTGTKESRCSICGTLNWSRTIAKTSHTAGAWQTDGTRHWRNCTECGEQMNLGEHVANKKEPYCTDRVYCTVCYTELRAAGKHSAYVATDSGDDTYHDMKCPDCGYVSSRVKHTYTYDNKDCTKGRTCSDCGHHASGNSSHTLSSTWTGVSGGHAKKCTVSGCAYMVTESHTWGDWYVAYEPTTTSIGTEAANCTKCSAVMTRTIPKLTVTEAPQATEAPADTSTLAPETSDAPSATEKAATEQSVATEQTATAEQTTPAQNNASATAAPAPTDSTATTATTETAAQTNPATQTPDDAPVTAEPVGDPAAEPTAAAVIASAADEFPAAPAVTIAAGSASCEEQGRECAWEEFLLSGLLVRTCTVCGDVVAVPLFSDAIMIQPVFQTITGVTVTGTTPAKGGLILRAADLMTADSMSVSAYAAIAVAWELDGASIPLEEAVQISVPLTVGEAAEEGTLATPTEAFRLVRVDVSGDEARVEEWTDIDFTYEDGVLTFELAQTGIYLLIPA